MYTEKKICSISGDSDITEKKNTVSKWFARFRSGDVDLENWEYFDMSAIIDDDQVEIMIKNNPDHTSQDIQTL